MCYVCRMKAEIAARELRNRTADVLRRVEAGDEIVITTRGKPVAALVPLISERRGWLPRAELARRLATAQADSGLRADLAQLAGETTDDLGPLALR
jgi:prevent-host-death family protein